MGEGGLGDRSSSTGRETDSGDPTADEGKALVFVHDRTTLASLKTRLEAATGRRVAIFHEDLAADRRDLEVAEFRRCEGRPSSSPPSAGAKGATSSSAGVSCSSTCRAIRPRWSSASAGSTA